LISFLDRNEQAGGRSSGFDYLRIILALAVMGAHSVATSYGEEVDYEVWKTPLRPFLCLLLPMFFALSGYLVALSFYRSKTLLKFLSLRIIRIYPALVAETVLSAFVLGPLFTTLTLHDYFTDPLFKQYMLNMFGDVHFFLPGLFDGNPYYPLVNAQLWTVPYELLCYISLACLATIGALRYRVLGLISPILLASAYCFTRLYRHGGELPGHNTAVPGPFLVISFLCGVAICLYREKLPHNLGVFLVCAGISIFIYSDSVATGSFADYIAPFTVAYCTIYLGLTNVPRIRLINSADYSYGIFLYHFSIQQAIMHSVPWARQWYLNLAICLPITVVFAVASWHSVERPFLSLRRGIDALEDRYLELWARGKRTALTLSYSKTRPHAPD